MREYAGSDFPSLDHGCGFIFRFLIFERRNGVVDDARARLNGKVPPLGDARRFGFLKVLKDQRADRDGKIHRAVVAEVTRCTAVKAARFRFKFANNLHGTYLRRA